MLCRDNQKSILENNKEVIVTMIKDGRYAHIIPTMYWVYRFTYTAHYLPQDMTIKEGKNTVIV